MRGRRFEMEMAPFAKHQNLYYPAYELPLRSLSIAALTFPPVCSSAATASSVFVKPIPAICSSCEAYSAFPAAGGGAAAGAGAGVGAGVR